MSKRRPGHLAGLVTYGFSTMDCVRHPLRMPRKEMEKITTKTLFVALLSLAASTALSQNSQGQNNNYQGQNATGVYEARDKKPGFSRGASTYTSAPEIDPAQALGTLTLLSGAVAIIRGYRRKKK
jgi:hypothetical protein